MDPGWIPAGYINSTPCARLSGQNRGRARRVRLDVIYVYVVHCGLRAIHGDGREGGGEHGDGLEGRVGDLGDGKLLANR